MKKKWYYFTFYLFFLLLPEILFAQSIDSSKILLKKNLFWQSGNRFRPVIFLNGKWEKQKRNESSFQKVTVPGPCNAEGEIIFRRSFEVNGSLSDYHFRLICYGVNNYCEIFINNKFIGSHAGSYTSFYIDIPENFIRVGEKNRIEIKVDTRLDNKNTLPLKYQFDGLRYSGGIIRDIYLLALPRLSLFPTLDYSLNSDFSRCDLSVTMNVENWQQQILFSPFGDKSLPRLKYLIEVFDIFSGSRIIRQIGRFSADEDMVYLPVTEKFILKNPRLWSPEKPNRYRISIKLFANNKQIDLFNTSFGIRQLDFFNGDIFLNGEQYFLRGINWIENYGKSGIVFDFENVVEQMITVKQLNANALRVPFFPPHPWIVGLCDSLGLFLLEEIPLSSIPPNLFYSDVFLTLIRDYLNETISRDAGHVSLFAIGVGGGYNADNQNSLPFIERVYPLLTKTNNLHFYFNALPPLTKNPYLPDMVAGISLIRREPTEMKKLLQKWLNQRLNAPTIVTSFGAPKYKFSVNDEDSVLYEKYQSAQIAQAFETIRSFDAIDGCFITALSDFKGNYASTLPGDIRDPYLKPYGLTSCDYNPRFAMKTVRDMFSTGNAVYNPGITLFAAQVNAFILAGLILSLIFLFTMHNRRYFRDNLKRGFVHPHGFYTDIRDGRKIPVSHTLLIALFGAIAGLGLIFASLAYFYKSNAIFDHLLTLIFFSPQIKEFVARQIWIPQNIFLFFAVAISLYLVFFAAVFRVICFVFRVRTQLSKMLTLSVWSTNIFILLLPVGMIAYRLLAFEHLRKYLFLLLAIFFIWYLFRAITGLRVFFMMPVYKVSLIFFIVAFSTIFAIIYFLQTHSGFWDYFSFYWQLYRGAIHFLF